MIDEIPLYRFACSIRFLIESAVATKPASIFDLGGWYGTVARGVISAYPLQRYIVYEAVTEFAEYLKTNIPQLDVRNETIATRELYRPTFFMDDRNTVVTSGLFTPQVQGTVEKPVGPLITPQELVDRHADLWSESGVKVNIEGFDLDVVDRLLASGQRPLFMLFEVFGSQRARFFETIWPRLCKLYNLSLTEFTARTGRVLHVGVRADKVAWWTIPEVLTNPTVYNEL